LPNTDWVYSHIISLPIYPEIASQQDYICNLINESVRDGAGKAGGRVAVACIAKEAGGTLKKEDYLKTYMQREVKSDKSKTAIATVPVPGKTYLKESGYLKTYLRKESINQK
jgi:hypothetical protein